MPPSHPPGLQTLPSSLYSFVLRRALPCTNPADTVTQRSASVSPTVRVGPGSAVCLLVAIIIIIIIIDCTGLSCSKPDLSCLIRDGTRPPCLGSMES